ncbi:monooxygenase [Streptomyces purpurascens]
MLGSVQSASSVNYVHVLDEQATHVAEVIAEAHRRQAPCVEPTAEAEAAWRDTIRQKSADLYTFQSECTPGYYNGEGMPRPRSESYGDGPVAFYELIRRWRAEGGMSEVLGS